MKLFDNGLDDGPGFSVLVQDLHHDYYMDGSYYIIRAINVFLLARYS